MRSRTLRLVVGLASSVPLTKTLDAQRVREGFWLSWAPGGVAVAGDEGVGYAGYLRLGGTLGQRLLVGAEWHALILDLSFGPGATSAGTSNIAGIVVFYPRHSGSLFGKAGVGLSAASVSPCIAPTAPPEPGGMPTAGDDRSGTSYGLGATLGVGYDVRLGRNFYITPNVDLFVQSHERPCLDPGMGTGPLRDTSPAIAFTIGMTWH